MGAHLWQADTNQRYHYVVFRAREFAEDKWELMKRVVADQKSGRYFSR